MKELFFSFLPSVKHSRGHIVHASFFFVEIVKILACFVILTLLVSCIPSVKTQPQTSSSVIDVVRGSPIEFSETTYNVIYMVGSDLPIKITVNLHSAQADIWQWTCIMQVPITANVTITNESPYTSGTLHYQIVNLDTNTTVTDWTPGESVLIDAKTNTTVAIETTVPIQRNFDPEHFRAKVKLSLISQTIEAETDFTVEKDVVRQFYGNVALLSLCACLVGVGVYSYRQKLEPWKKYPTEQKRKHYPDRKGKS